MWRCCMLEETAKVNAEGRLELKAEDMVGLRPEETAGLRVWSVSLILRYVGIVLRLKCFEIVAFWVISGTKVS